MCPYQPDVESNVAVMLLLSDNEVLKPSNTGRLIADTIKETYVYQWNRTEPDAEMLQLLNDQTYQPIVVFPDEYVDDETRVISTELNQATQGKKPLFIFLDGSWREARKMFRRSDYLQGLPVLSVEPKRVSEYLMRKSDNEQHLSTVEVATLVMEMAGEQEASKWMRLWFEAFRESYLASKTRLKVDPNQPYLTSLKLALESERSL